MSIFPLFQVISFSFLRLYHIPLLPPCSYFSSSFLINSFLDTIPPPSTLRCCCLFSLLPLFLFVSISFCLPLLLLPLSSSSVYSYFTSFSFFSHPCASSSSGVFLQSLPLPLRLLSIHLFLLLLLSLFFFFLSSHIYFNSFSFFPRLCLLVLFILLPASPRPPPRLIHSSISSPSSSHSLLSLFFSFSSFLFFPRPCVSSSYSAYLLLHLPRLVLFI